MDDLWWHLAAGRATLSEGLPLTNLWSWTAPDAPWSHHSWLSSVIFYLVYRTGVGGLLALCFLLYAGTCALLWRLARLRGGVFAASLITGLGGLLLLGNFGIRPFLFGNICFALCLLLVEEPEGWLQRRRLRLGLLFALWANLHGSVLLGLAVLLVYLVGDGLRVARGRRLDRDPRGRLLDLLVAVGASCITPRGPATLLLPLDYVRQSYGQKNGILTIISEWQPLELQSALGVVVTCFIVIVFGSVLFARRRPRLSTFFVALLFTGFATQQVRHIPLMVLACAPLAGVSLTRSLPEQFVGRLSGLKELHRAARGGPLLTGLGLLLGLCVFPPNGSSYLSLIDRGSLEGLSSRAHPTTLIDELGSRGRAAPKRLLNNFDWGAAILWELSPHVEVFIDARNDCYPEDVVEDYITLRWMKVGWREVIERRAPDALAFPPEEPLVAALRVDPGWAVSWEDDSAVLLVPRQETSDPLTESQSPVPLEPPHSGSQSLPASASLPPGGHEPPAPR